VLKDDLGKYSKEIESYLTASSNFGIVLLDANLVIHDCNIGFMRLFGPRQNPVGEPLNAYLELDASGFRCGEELKLSCSRKSGKEGIIHCQFIQADNGYLLIRNVSMTLRHVPCEFREAFFRSQPSLVD